MTPSFSGRMALMWAGVRPIIRLASCPTATGRPSLTLTATTEGSFSTMPSPRRYTSVLAVPRSTAMSRPMIEEKEESTVSAILWSREEIGAGGRLRPQARPRGPGLQGRVLDSADPLARRNPTGS